MARAPETVQDELLSLLPTGWAFRRDRASNLALLFWPLAAGIADFEASAEAQLSEIDMRSAVNLLPDYERVLGPDPCLAPIAGQLTFQDRQRIAWQRWTMQGGGSAAFFVALGAGFAIPVTITQQWTRPCGVLACGQDLVGPPEQFTWIVGLPSAVVSLFVAGGSVCGEDLGGFVPSFLECVIRRFAPAHTVPVFNYS